MIEYDDMTDSDYNIAYLANPLHDAYGGVFLTDLFTKPDHPFTEEAVADYTAFYHKIMTGQVKKLVRGEDGYEEATATMEDVFKVCRYNRNYMPSGTVEDILMKRRDPTDLHLYADDFGGNDEEI